MLWSSQGLKDGPIVFLLAVAMLATLKLGERLSGKYFVVLVCALSGLLTLRFYIFYMALAAVVGSFAIGMRAVTSQSLARQFVIIMGMGLALTYLGVLRTAGGQLEQYGDLERVQISRADLAGAQSGFGREVDVSTTAGALTAIPLGVVYLLFAPFPWQLTNLRQSITLPEMMVWWGSFPLLVLGRVVHAQVSVAAGVADPDFHVDADAGVLDLSGQRRDGVPAAVAVAGLLLHLCRRRIRPAQGAARGKESSAVWRRDRRISTRPRIARRPKFCDTM